jgi:hypothetical protein
MNWLWRLLFVIAVGVSLWFAWDRHEKYQVRANDIQKLIRIVNSRNNTAMTSATEVEQSFIKALALIAQYTNEPIRTDYRGRTISGTRTLISEVSDAVGQNADDRALVYSALIEALDRLEQFTGLTPEALEALDAGQWPTITRGPFRGEKIRLGWRVSPVICPSVKNQTANLILMSESIWALQDDRICMSMMADARKFQSAGLIQPNDWTSVQFIWNEANVK